MKLNLKDIQLLDATLKRLVSINKINKDLKLVINYNNSFYCGDFVELNSVYIVETYLHEDGYIEKQNHKSFNDLLSFPEQQYLPWYKKLYNVVESNNKILLKELIDILNSCNKKAPIESCPMMFNITCLDKQIDIPYLYLDDSTEYEVVSIIEK